MVCQSQEPLEAEWISLPISDTGMNRINMYAFFALGKRLQSVVTMDEKNKTLDLTLDAMRADAMLRLLISGQLNIHLKATNEAASQVSKDLAILLQYYDKQKEGSLTFGVALHSARESIARFEHVLGAELPLAPVYSVPARGVFSTDLLLESADNVFGDVRDKIPDEAREETKQAGRCLAFDLPTAAGFHIARATEVVMVKAMSIFGCPKPQNSQRNWGQYIKALEDKGANTTVIHHLKQLKDLHRNPMIHPEVTLSSLEAQQLWALCTSAMIAIVADMERKSGAPSQQIVGMLPTSTNP